MSDPFYDEENERLNLRKDIETHNNLKVDLNFFQYNFCSQSRKCT